MVCAAIQAATISTARVSLSTPTACVNTLAQTRKTEKLCTGTALPLRKLKMKYILEKQLANSKLCLMQASAITTTSFAAQRSQLPMAVSAPRCALSVLTCRLISATLSAVRYMTVSTLCTWVLPLPHGSATISMLIF